MLTILQTLIWTSLSFADLSNGDRIEIVENQLCNEVKVGQINWQSSVQGGSYSAARGSFRSLKENRLEQIAFGRSAQINLTLGNKKVIPESFSENTGFSPQFFKTTDEKGVITGRFLALTNLTPGSWFQVGPGKTDFLWSVILGVLYFNNDPSLVPSEVKCKYISGDIAPYLSGKSSDCIWFDRYTRAQNGKSYCF